MTNDKAVYTIEFSDDVSTGAVSTIKDSVDGSVLNVEIQTHDNIATVSVWGDSNAIPVWESEWRDELSDLYPSATIECEVFPGEGVENSP